MTYYLRMRFLLLLLPVIMTIGMPHLPGSPLDLDHSVDLSVPLLLLFLLTWAARRGGCRLSEDDIPCPPCLASETLLALVGGWR